MLVPSLWHRAFSRWLGALACFTPTLLLAHPGHYHPDETDEFDFLRATLFHSHGAMDYGIVIVAVISLAIVCFHTKPIVRISAIAAALGALALLPVV